LAVSNRWQPTKVLCGYLGQLARVRDALAGEVAVLIDERDQAELAGREEEEICDPIVEQVKVAKRVSRSQRILPKSSALTAWVGSVSYQGILIFVDI
jgi:hypothetical protein